MSDVQETTKISKTSF